MDIEWENMSEENRLDLMKNNLLTKRQQNEEKFLNGLMTSFEKK